MFCNQAINGFFSKESKNGNPFFCIRICGIQPELVKLVRGCPIGIQPNIASFGFAEFTTIGLDNQWTGENKRFSSRFPTDQFGSGGHVSPLVAAPKLQFAVQVIVEPVKV